MKLPKLYALNVPLGVVRSNKNAYELDKKKCFEPKNHEDFYFFISQGFLLADDPKVKDESYESNSGMSDEDVINERAKRKGSDIIPQIENDVAFKDQCYKDYFAKVENQIAQGEMAGYPSDMSEKAEEYYQELKAKRIEEIGRASCRERV